MITVKFYTLSGKFDFLREQTFATMQEVHAAVQAHAASGGFTNVKELAEDCGCALRFTARTPGGRGGRGGRNIAYVDFE